ncbi:CDP-alcohol phosphatidyltransferase family protein [Streptococcus ferus]|uniref:CDP-alcohol phosphatidyltransferase family protein n=1 Tax=Streptococcus ferus TaxID=1345 RepID=UPI00351668BC
MFIGEYKLSNLLSYLGAALSVVSMTYVWSYDLDLAMIFFILAGLCDLFDGRFARLFKRSTAEQAFGIELDSLCDMINFVALPLVLLIQVAYQGWLTQVIAILYALAAITRLAYFNRNAKGAEERAPYFIGLPVTYSALVFPVWYVICSIIHQDLFGLSLPYLVVLLSLAFVWNRQIPKPDKKAYQIFLILALLTTAYLLVKLLW